MTASATDARHALDALRDEGAERMDPVRFQRIDALARRTVSQHGNLRRLLDVRLSGLVGAYRDEWRARAAGEAPRTAEARPAGRPGTAMSALLDHLARETAAAHVDFTATSTPALPSAMDRLDEVRRVSARARTDSQLRQALERPPENAGPLNSTSLVYRALNLVRGISPDYLPPFMAYVDALACLEDMALHVEPAPKHATASAPGARKRTGGKAQSPRAKKRPG